MTTILTTLALAFFLSLFITPLAGWFGKKIGAVDMPGERKIHLVSIPRSGGIAIFVSFCLAIAASKLLSTQITDQLIFDEKIVAFFIGALVISGVGLLDDIYCLNHKIKFLTQIVCASIAFYGGMRVHGIFYISSQNVVISYALTLFWFLLVINAVNLIDGLDGLAAGICFFTSTVLTFFLFMKNMYVMSMLFAAVAGTTLGFLRYNFNPASIFMGDGGSYFLGYTIAALSVMAGIKSQAGIVMAIPLLAMGIPVFDTILSPIRRFLLGKKMFQPDKSHVHHRLLDLGFSSRNVVLFVYACSLVLCLIALILTAISDRHIGIFLIVLAAISVVFIRKLGYFEYIAMDKILGWFKDISDVTGISKDRRTFLNLQIEISKSKDIEELWNNICIALDHLKFDRADFFLKTQIKSGAEGKACESQERRRNGNKIQDQSKLFSMKRSDDSGQIISLHWARGCYRRENDILKEDMFVTKIPIINGSLDNIKILFIAKDLRSEQLTTHTIRRIEHLRRAVLSALQKIENSK